MILMKIKNLCKSLLVTKIIPTVGEHSKIIHKGMLLCEECFDTLETFPNGKAPGIDSLILIFYTCNFTLSFNASCKNLYQLLSSLILLYVIGVKFAKLYFMQSNVLLVKVRIYIFCNNVDIGLKTKQKQQKHYYAWKNSFHNNSCSPNYMQTQKEEQCLMLFIQLTTSLRISRSTNAWAREPLILSAEHSDQGLVFL